jgi:hypothetical protein
MYSRQFVFHIVHGWPREGIWSQYFFRACSWLGGQRILKIKLDFTINEKISYSQWGVTRNNKHYNKHYNKHNNKRNKHNNKHNNKRNKYNNKHNNKHNKYYKHNNKHNTINHTLIIINNSRIHLLQ